MIKFGTGGWREIIADGFTKENQGLPHQGQAFCAVRNLQKCCHPSTPRIRAPLRMTALSVVVTALNDNLMLHTMNKDASLLPLREKHCPLCTPGMRRGKTDGRTGGISRGISPGGFPLDMCTKRQK